MRRIDSRPTVRMIFASALLTALLLPWAARAGEPAAPQPSSRSAFDELYDRLTVSPEGDRPEPGVGPAAEEIRFVLETDLIRSDAEIEVLKLEAARFSGERQQTALETLVRAAAARERRLWMAIRQLEKLAGEPALAVEEPRPGDPQPEADTRRGSFGITSEPADVIEDPDP